MDFVVSTLCVHAVVVVVVVVVAVAAAPITVAERSKARVCDRSP